MPPEIRGGAMQGVVVAVVTDNKDPDGLARVRLSFPGETRADEWARVVTPMAGAGRGFYCLPEVGDEVVVAFERGDPGRPYVLGALWSETAPPPEKNEEGANNRRVFRSRSGHAIVLDDTVGAERVEIVDGTSNTILLDASDNTVSVFSGGDVTIESRNGTLRLKGAVVEIEGATVKVSGQALTSVEGAVVTIN